MTVRKVCENCKYSMAVDDDLYCHVNGPRRIKRPGVERLEYPPVTRDHWCPKWRPGPDAIINHRYTRD